MFELLDMSTEIPDMSIVMSTVGELIAKQKQIPADEKYPDDKPIKKESEKPYFDKENHLERSIGNDQRNNGHIKHKEQKII